MNERKQPSPPSENDSVDPPVIAAEAVEAGTTVVFAGDPEQVSAGFLIALQLLGIGAPMAGTCPDDPKLPRKFRISE